MFTRILAVSLALLLALVACAQEDADRILLRYQWNAGDEIIWQIASETTGTVVTRDLTKDPVAETSAEIWTSATMPMTLTVDSSDAQGNGTIAYYVGIIEMDMAAGGQQHYMRIDPQARTMTMDGEEMPLPEQSMLWMTEPMRMVTSPRGELLELQLPEGSPLGGMAGLDLTQWMRLSQQWQMVFPEEPVPEGYSWYTSMAVPFGGEGAGGGEAGEAEAPKVAPAATMVLTHAGRETVNGVDCVRVEMVGAMDIDELPLSLGQGSGMGAMMPEGLEMRMGPMHVSVAGSFLFDPAAGEVVSTQARLLIDLDQRMTGTVETPDGAQTVDMEIFIRDMLVETTASRP